MKKLPLTEPELSRFAEQLGRMLLRLPIVSGCAGHQKGEYTVKDYLRPTSLETEFLIDIMSRSTPEVLLKWYPRVETADGAIFHWVDTAPQGGPGRKELDEAYKMLVERGEVPAKYP